ncbi:MAG TPA: dUTP diphosphatase [Thermoanaerobaculia bacterium]|nr:dUTP diphosphatase [Thermoanaerobaculia bacterium]
MTTRDRLTVRFVRLEHGRDLAAPAVASAGSAGSDLRAAVTVPITIAPGERALVPTGIALEIPPGWEGQVRPRSGLAAAHGVTVLNAPGTIDADYRGEIGVLLVNLGTSPFEVRRGDRVAQIVFAPVATARWQEAAALGSSERGGGGFGSTGS